MPSGNMPMQSGQRMGLDQDMVRWKE